VTVTVALNGQDFNEVSSDAEVTFLGTGTSARFLYFVIATILIGLLILALMTYCSSWLHRREIIRRRKL